MSLAIASTSLQQLLDDARAKHGVPGASLAVLSDDEVSTVASGVLNVDTGVEATGESLFQIGSITKVWTTTVVMQLVDEGLVELDAPLRRYLPSSRWPTRASPRRSRSGTCSRIRAASTAIISPTPAAVTTRSRSTS